MDAAVVSAIVLAGGVIIGGIVGAIRGVIRFAQYLSRSEAAQAKTAQSNQDIADDLARYMRGVDDRFQRVEVVLVEHGQEIAVLRDRTVATRRTASEAT